MKSLLFLALAGLLLAGCTTTDEIIIDQQGVDMSHYQQDLLECRQLAQQVRTGEKAARGAGSGALLGAAVGAILHGAERAVGVRHRRERFSAVRLIAVAGIEKLLPPPPLGGPCELTQGAERVALAGKDARASVPDGSGKLRGVAPLLAESPPLVE